MVERRPVPELCPGRCSPLLLPSSVCIWTRSISSVLQANTSGRDDLLFCISFSWTVSLNPRGRIKVNDCVSGVQPNEMWKMTMGIWFDIFVHFPFCTNSSQDMRKIYRINQTLKLTKRPNLESFIHQLTLCEHLCFELEGGHVIYYNHVPFKNAVSSSPEAA